LLDRNVVKSFSVLPLSLFSLASVAQTPKPELQHADATNSASPRPARSAVVDWADAVAAPQT